ncbi:MAG: Lrp/AsnC family transcriptional regulator [Sphingosinicella sp.]|nr:Lrp/AsnC family transcriptional regulator [Sphingosinicella sp.]
METTRNMTGRRLDDQDQKLIAALCRNARQPLVKLARDLGLSRSATQERLNRLERDGIIQGYTAQIREGILVSAWASIELHDSFSCDSVIPALRAMDEIRQCYALSGPTDMLVLIEAASLERISELREVIADLASVRRITIAPVLLGIKL